MGHLIFRVWKTGVAFGVVRCCENKNLRSGTCENVFWRHHLELTDQTKRSRFYLFGGNRSGS